jgi:hypothetical protein
MLRTTVQTLAPVLAGVFALAGVVEAGRHARAALRGQDAWGVPLNAVECAAPAGLTRVEFLDEVQYLSGCPDRMSLLNDGAPARLADAFARHPWVEAVRRVEVLPGRRVRADLALRRPVLAVSLPVSAHLPGGSVLVETRLVSGGTLPCRAVDRHGVLLPAGAGHIDLPVLQSRVRSPAGPPGTDWGDDRVAAAAALTDFLGPHLDRLRLADATLEASGPDLVFRRPLLRLVWGRRPGREADDEAAASVKLGRLLQFAADHDGLDGHDLDLRPAGGLRQALIPAVAGR